MSKPQNGTDWQARRVSGWNDILGRWTSGLSLFLTLTGLAVFALPFSVFTQHALLVHALLGILFLPVAAIYLARHMAAWLAFPLTHIKFTGYVAGAMVLVCAVSGVWLTVEGALGTRITYAWRTVHIVTTFGLVLFLVPHLVAVFLRKAAADGDGAAPRV